MTNEHNNEEKDFLKTDKDTESINNPDTKEESCDTKPSETLTQKKKKMKLWKKILLIILCIFLSLILLLVGTFGYLVLSGKSKLLEDKAEIKIPANIEAEVDEDEVLVYNGEEYIYNENIATILCMGIDTDIKSSGPTAQAGSAGQADALYLIVMDTDTGKLTIIAIPRDTIAEVDVYSKNGKYSGTQNMQICLSYSYGDGKDESCQNTSRSVSRLLMGMPINSYFAIDYRSIPAIHKAVGNVTVIPNENLKIYKEGNTYYFKKGKLTDLPSYLAFEYLQTRNTSSLDAAYLRMERQIDYIKSYGKTAFKKTKQDITFPVTLYKKIKNNSITNLDVSKITFLATCAVSNMDNINLNFVKLQGEYTEGENGFAELQLNEEQLFDTVISLFYKKQNN